MPACFSTTFLVAFAITITLFPRGGGDAAHLADAHTHRAKLNYENSARADAVKNHLLLTLSPIRN
eukprot:scaffold1350_cov113-Isochrysis_galbana.AAC.2